MRPIREMFNRASRDLDVAQFAACAKNFKKELQSVQKRLPRPSPDWYPYDSLVIFYALDEMLTGENRFLLRLTGGQRVLDLGCGDGELSFFLESLGCRVCAIDHPPTNFNRMQGVYSLKGAFESQMEILEVDVDRQFRMGGERYGLALMLGVLYHLKNPFNVLETLAEHCQYCLLSTGVARVSADRSLRFADIPVAYLVDEREMNNDPTNYWVFSEAGLRRLLKRTHWRILDFATFGCKIDSDPVRADADERAVCLLESECEHR